MSVQSEIEKNAYPTSGIRWFSWKPFLVIWAFNLLVFMFTFSFPCNQINSLQVWANTSGVRNDEEQSQAITAKFLYSIFSCPEQPLKPSCWSVRRSVGPSVRWSGL